MDGPRRAGQDSLGWRQQRASACWVGPTVVHEAACTGHRGGLGSWQCMFRQDAIHSYNAASAGLAQTNSGVTATSLLSVWLPRPLCPPAATAAARREKGQKCVHLDVAVAMWQLLVSPSRWQHIAAWCEFLQEHHKRAISRDTWTQLLDFMQVGGGATSRS